MSIFIGMRLLAFFSHFPISCTQCVGLLISLAGLHPLYLFLAIEAEENFAFVSEPFIKLYLFYSNTPNSSSLKCVFSSCPKSPPTIVMITLRVNGIQRAAFHGPWPTGPLLSYSNRNFLIFSILPLSQWKCESVCFVLSRGLPPSECYCINHHSATSTED